MDAPMRRYSEYRDPMDRTLSALRYASSRRPPPNFPSGRREMISWTMLLFVVIQGGTPAYQGVVQNFKTETDCHEFGRVMQKDSPALRFRCIEVRR